MRWIEPIERGVQQGRSLILRQLTRRVGELPESVRSQIDALSILQLEALGEAVLDFSGLSDLEGWLAEQGQ
jgi:predicted transposase YdaD